MTFKKTSAALVALLVALGGAVVTAPTAEAAYSRACSIYANKPTTNGVTMYSKGSAYCSAGHVVGVGTNTQAQGLYNQYSNVSTMTWTWKNAASLAHTSSWSCNGTGKKTYRTRATGQNNAAEKGTAYSAGVSLTC